MNLTWLLDRKTDPEFYLGEGMGRERNDYKERTYGPGRVYGRYSSLDIHLIGVHCEISVAKFLGVPVDRRIFRYHGDYGFDMVHPQWGRIEVKGNSYDEDPHLRIAPYELRKALEEDVKVFVLAVYDFKRKKEAQVVGWATLEMVVNGDRRSYGHGKPKNYVVYPEQLRPFQELMNASPILCA